MDGSGPPGWATLLDRAGGGDPHRVRVHRLEQRDGRHEHGVIADRAGEAGDPLLPGGQAVLPQLPQRVAGVRAELKRGAGAGGVGLRRQQPQWGEAEECDDPGAQQDLRQ